MKKAVLFFVFAVVVVSFFTVSCTKSPTTPVATPTPVPNLQFTAQVVISSGAGVTMGQITIVTAGSVAVNDATVTMNGQGLTFAGSGGYVNMALTGIVTGTTVNLAISSPEGNASGSVVMPASSMAVGSTSGAVAGSVYMAQHT